MNVHGKEVGHSAMSRKAKASMVVSGNSMVHTEHLTKCPHDFVILERE